MEPINLPQFRDVSWRWIAYATSAIVTLAIVFAFFHEVELKQDVRAEIVSPAEIKIQGLSGLVSDVYVQQSAHVTPGVPLFRLERDLSLASDGRQRPAFDEHMRDEQIHAVEAQYDQRKAELNAQLDTSRLTEASRRAEPAALDEQVAQNRQLVDESGRKLSRLESVSDYVTADRIEQARAETHQARVVAAQSAARRQQLLAELAAAKSTQTVFAAQLAELGARQDRDIQAIRIRFEENRQNTTISAPKAGIVTFSGLVQGRTLTPSDVALVIATGKSDGLRAALRIPSRRRGFVREGQIVRLKFDAFPYAKSAATKPASIRFPARRSARRCRQRARPNRAPPTATIWRGPRWPATGSISSNSISTSCRAWRRRRASSSSAARSPSGSWRRSSACCEVDDACHLSK